MTDPLDAIRAQINDDADAIRWACILEATAPKVGNVHPTCSFEDLCYQDFVVAAYQTAKHLTRQDVPLSRRMFDAVHQCRHATSTNVNLGIVLLLGPLVAAPSHETDAIAAVLSSFTPQDGRIILDAIRIAGAGGLGDSDSMDVAVESNQGVDVLAAMTLAKSYDRIALQYAENFADLLRNVVPVVERNIRQKGDLLSGVSEAHLEILSAKVDTLIARKCGMDVAADVRKRAQAVDRNDAQSIADFDRFLRSRGNRLNPGTTADLIAVALFVLFCRPLTSESS